MKKERCEILESTDLMDYTVWIYMLGQCQRDLEVLRDELEKFVNRNDFDENNEFHQMILKTFLQLQTIAMHMVL